jgi:S-adenosylmethionine hydrolase
MVRSLITLTSDFGLRDPYVAEMKAVIMSLCSDVAIVDISHEIDKFNVRMGAYVLASASPFFPKGTIHVAVVDPGVGTRRRALCVESKGCVFLGPDNGLLVLAAKARGIGRVYEVTNRRLMMPIVSNTFQGRDVFCPVAAHLASGASLSDVGPETKRVAIPEFAKVVTGRYRIVGEVVYIDDFGNVITNIAEFEVESVDRAKEVKLRVGRSGLLVDFCGAYGDVEAGKPVVLIGSHGFLEVSINQGSAERELRARIGDRVTVYRS